MPKKDLTAEKNQPESQENLEKSVETSSIPETDLQVTNAEETLTEGLIIEDLVTEEPELEEPVTELPIAEEPALEEPVMELPVAEEPAVEEPVMELPVAEEPSVEEPVMELPVAEEPLVEEPVMELPVEVEPSVEEPVMELPVAEEPLVEEPVMETAITAGQPEEEAPSSVAETRVSEELTGELTTEPDQHPEIHADAAFLRELHDMDVHTAEAEIEEEDEEGLEYHEEIVEKYDTYDREKLVEILEETVREENILKIKTRVALIKVAFLRLSKEYRQLMLDTHLNSGGTRENYVPAADPLVEKFNHVFETYKKNKIKFNEQQEVVKLRNLDAKKAILEELKELINSEETLKKTYDQFKDLQTKWKEIGLVPSTEINNLWQNYHFLVEKFFDKVKISKELRDLDLKKNLERKLELCEKAEELLIEPSVIRSFQQLQKYHEEWKEVGPVPQDKRDEIWERFKTATDKINERRRDHYNSLAKDQDTNLLAKIALCEKAEQLASMEIDNLKDWQEKTREVNDLLKVWKTIGPAPKKENDEIWEKFKAFLNGFFANKKEFFSKIKQEQLNNFNLKLDIVKQAEALKESTDWRKTTQELISLQKEWKNIGPVPRKHSDKIWKRFRAACDEFFHNKSKFFSTVVESEKENLDKKLELISRIETWEAGKDKSANLEALKGFQREFTEIGHVPIKEKNRVHDAFRQAINKHFDGLKISSYEMRQGSEYRSRQESSYDDGGDGRYQRRSGGSSEWSALSTKVSKLREEILLWENNIGFLAHSKKADLLRQEFEKKIQDAKTELAQLEARLKNMQE
ncbi:MAG: DUF349 domain-containing protein [Bacteroidales bacterium]|jgi:hypothetical protein|nr:DUF349 domain-containing protein [Bacteroidales bacterium]